MKLIGFREKKNEFTNPLLKKNKSFFYNILKYNKFSSYLIYFFCEEQSN